MIEVLQIGAGNMGFAMLRTWITMEGFSFSVVEVDEGLRKRAEKAGGGTYGAIADLPPRYDADILVIATKPQTVADAIAASHDRLRRDGLLLSVAAGAAIGTMRRSVGEGLVVVRAMPNTPAAIGEGMIVCCASMNAREADRERT